MHHCSLLWKSLRESWQAFFFSKEIPYGMALVRICLSGVLLVVMGRRWPYVREFFSSDGAPTPIAVNYGYYDFLPVASGTTSVALYSAMLFLMFTLMIGWKTRFSAIAVFLLYTYFTMQDSLSTITKYTVISSHALLMLSLAECGAVWSVDRLQELRRQGLARPLSLLGAGRAVVLWPQRLLQILIAVVYFGAAVTKMQTATYFSGDQLRFWMLTNVNHWNPIGEWMTLYPALLVPMCYIAIVWEVTFLFMVWRKWFRLPYLIVGAIFHIMTTLTLGLIVFPLVCISVYCCYLTAEDIDWLREFAARRRRGVARVASTCIAPLRWVAGGLEPVCRTGVIGFAAGLLCLTAGGLLTEKAMNVYADPATGGKYVLQPLPPETAARMLRSDTHIAERDKLFSFDIGRFQVGGLVVETGREFTAGQTVFAQASLIPPRGDLFIECQLVSERGLIYEQATGVATRDNFRYTFPVRLSSLMDPGRYQFLLKFNGKEVARQTIQVRPAVVAAVTE